MNISKALLATAAASMVLFTACKKDDEAPQIVVESPANETVVAPGSTFELEIDFTDNEELSEYDIDIHEAGGHSHGKVAAEWDAEFSGQLSGTSEHVHLDISVPGDAEVAAYHIEVNCLDKEGNKGQEVVEIDVE